MGAYSELDIDHQYGDDPFADDEGDDICVLPNDDAGYAPQGEPEPAPVTPPQQPQGNAPEARPVEQPPAAPAQPADNADKAAADEAAKRKAHEEAEAKRKAEWQAEKKKKKEAEKLQIAQIDNMSNDEVTAKSLERVSIDTEKLTRRQMMECVMEHIQTLCLSDPDFARKVMHPRKNMIRCYQYINRKAWEYVQDELKARGITPTRTDPYASAIPDGVCYQWAVDYFNDPNAQEDKEKEEKFVSKPYLGATTTTAKSTEAKGGTTAQAGTAKAAAPKAAKPAAPKKPSGDEQISFGGFAMPEEKAG